MRNGDCGVQIYGDSVADRVTYRYACQRETAYSATVSQAYGKHTEPYGAMLIYFATTDSPILGVIL